MSWSNCIVVALLLFHYIIHLNLLIFFINFFLDKWVDLSQTTIFINPRQIPERVSSSRTDMHIFILFLQDHRIIRTLISRCDLSKSSFSSSPSVSPVQYLTYVILFFMSKLKTENETQRIKFTPKKANTSFSSFKYETATSFNEVTSAKFKNWIFCIWHI